jgi:hypothetical protein
MLFAHLHERSSAKEHAAQTRDYEDSDDGDLRPLWQQLTVEGPKEKLLVQRMQKVTSALAVEDLRSTEGATAFSSTSSKDDSTARILLDQMKRRMIAERLVRDQETKQLRQTIEELGTFVMPDGSTARHAHRKQRALQSELSSCQHALKLESRLRAASERSTDHLKLQNSILEASASRMLEALAARRCEDCRAKLPSDMTDGLHSADATSVETEHWQALALQCDTDASTAKARCEELSSKLAVLERKLSEGKQLVEHEIETKLEVGNRIIEVEMELGKALVPPLSHPHDYFDRICWLDHNWCECAGRGRRAEKQSRGSAA